MEEREREELLKKCDETMKLIEETQDQYDELLRELEELEEENGPEEMIDPEDDADWIVIF